MCTLFYLGGQWVEERQEVNRTINHTQFQGVQNKFSCPLPPPQEAIQDSHFHGRVWHSMNIIKEMVTVGTVAWFVTQRRIE